MRKEEFVITVESKSRLAENILCEKGMSVYDALLQCGIPFQAPCGGNGTCTGCKIVVKNGAIPPSDRDRQVFTQEQLQEGMRLACKAYPQSDCTILVPEQEKFKAVTTCGNEEQKAVKVSTPKDGQQDILAALAIDLGTTTIVYKLFDILSGNDLAVFSTVNEQRKYGADVINRIQASNRGLREKMATELKEQMRRDIHNLLAEFSDGTFLQKIGLCGNTVMIHLLMGYSCEKLGIYPFEPVTLSGINSNTRELGILKESIPFIIMPGISAYIGGDVLMGLVLLSFDRCSEPTFFLDLGTNGEMALNDGKGHILVTSAPAGPAFEGGNISCGIGSVPGAIEKVNLNREQICIRTIQDQVPVGICGSGVIETVYELRKEKIIDEMGLLQDAYFETGFSLVKQEKGRPQICMTQKDIREVQMAKSAIATAFEILLERSHISREEIVRVYLAGGFGYHIDVHKAAGIGIFPNEWENRVIATGNTALQGTKEFLMGNITEENINSCKAAAEEIYLSNEKEFEEIYLQNMYLK